MPGTTTPEQRRHPEQLVQVGPQRGLGPGVLEFDGDLAAVLPDRRDAPGRCSRRRPRVVVELAEPRRQPVPNCCAISRCTVVGGIGGAAFCSLVSASRYGAAYSSGIAGLVDAQRLAELHRAALERAEHLEDLFGRAALHLGGDLFPVPADQTLPQTQRGAAGGRQRQAGQPRRSAQGTTRNVGHLAIVYEFGARRSQLPRWVGRRAPDSAVPADAPALQPQSGCGAQLRRRGASSPILPLDGAVDGGGNGDPVHLVERFGDGNGGDGIHELCRWNNELPAQMLFERGASGSRSVRRLRAHTRQLDLPGRTKGPTTAPGQSGRYREVRHALPGQFGGQRGCRWTVSGEHHHADAVLGRGRCTLIVGAMRLRFDARSEKSARVGESGAATAETRRRPAGVSVSAPTVSAPEVPGRTGSREFRQIGQPERRSGCWWTCPTPAKASAPAIAEAARPLPRTTTTASCLACMTRAAAATP